MTVYKEHARLLLQSSPQVIKNSESSFPIVWLLFESHFRFHRNFENKFKWSKVSDDKKLGTFL